MTGSLEGIDTIAEILQQLCGLLAQSLGTAGHPGKEQSVVTLALSQRQT